jgi:hypothetical protein
MEDLNKKIVQGPDSISRSLPPHEEEVLHDTLDGITAFSLRQASHLIYRSNSVGTLAERNKSEVLLPNNRLRRGE